jgi:hypothetical protein
MPVTESKGGGDRKRQAHAVQLIKEQEESVSQEF